MKNKMSTMVSLKRTCAFVVDLLIFITVFSMLQTVFNLFYPGNYIPPKGMQLFTVRQLNVFFITILAAFTFLIIYLKLCYKTKLGQTLGRKIFGIKIVTLKNERLSSMRQNGIIALSALRFLILFIPGPVIAVMGGGLAFSVFALAWGVALVLPFTYKSRSEVVTLWQHLGGYKFVEAE